MDYLGDLNKLIGLKIERRIEPFGSGWLTKRNFRTIQWGRWHAIHGSYSFRLKLELRYIMEDEGGTH